jgi:hypothetical protein
MRQNLLRVGLVLLVAGLMFPAGAAARQGTPVETPHARAAMPTGWSAGPVQRWSGYSRPGGSRRVRELQRRLNRLGYEAGPVDGLFGPRTERATRRFQARHGLRVDAIAGPRTLRVLRTRDRRAARRVAHHAPVPHPVTTVLPSRLPQPVQGAPRATARPVYPGPELPIVPVLVAIGLLGAAAFVSSYLRTGARIRRMHDERFPTHENRRGPPARQEARS